jgi:ankyrin repeat protein
MKYRMLQVNSQDRMLETAMHRAARRNYFQAYALLKEAGGSDDIRNLMRETPEDVMVDR